MSPPHEHWMIEKKIPLALLIAILVQSLAVVWGAAVLTTRVDNLEKKVEASAPQGERIVRLEEKIGAVQQGIAELKALLQRTPPPMLEQRR